MIQMACAAVVSAATIQLPRTGQTNCYTAAGDTTTCANIGQDGDKKAGVALPNPRFSDYGYGNILDNLTALIWLKNANCPSGQLT